MFYFIAAFILLHVWFHNMCMKKCCKNLAGSCRAIAAHNYFIANKTGG